MFCTETKLQLSTHLVEKRFVLLNQIWNRWRIQTLALACSSLASRIKASSKYSITLSIRILFTQMRRRWRGPASALMQWSKKCSERNKLLLLNSSLERILKFVYVLSCHRMKLLIVLMEMTNQLASSSFLCLSLMIYVISKQLWITQDSKNKRKNRMVLLNHYLNKKKIRPSYLSKI